MAKEHEEYLVTFLDKNRKRSYTGQELKERLKDKYPQLSDDGARKALSRCAAQKRICSTKPVTFLRGQYAYFSVKANRNRNGRLFENSIKEYRTDLHRVIYALKRGSGVLSYNEMSNIAGVMIEHEGHNVGLEDLIKDLECLGIATMDTIGGIKYLHYKDKEPGPIEVEKLRNDLMDKNMLLSLCVTWLIRSNILDPTQACFLGERNNYKGIDRNGTIWDAFGYTRTVGLGGTERDFQTMVLVDFLHHSRYEQYDFEGFQKRVEHLIFSVRAENKGRKVLPIIMAFEFSPMAKALIRKNGYMCFEANTILGKNAIEIAARYREAKKKIEQDIDDKEYSEIARNISELYEYIKNQGNEENYGNMKGALFEYLMFPVFMCIFDKRGDQIHHSYSGSVKNQRFECDYWIETEDENIYIELKGYHRDYVIPLGEKDKESGEVPHQSIRWFLSHTYELAREYTGKTAKREPKFCYITTGKIEPKAKEEMIKRRKNESKRLNCFYEYDALIELLKSYGLKKEIEVLEQFFPQRNEESKEDSLEALQCSIVGEQIPDSPF